MNDAHKLEHLLEHWIEHNDSHRDEFERWASRARDAGLTDVASQISAAAARVDEASACLRKAQTELRETVEKDS